KELKLVSLSWNRNIRSLELLDAPSLKELWVENCGNYSDIPSLLRFPNLKSLSVRGTKVKDLTFLNSFPQLEKFFYDPKTEQDWQVLGGLKGLKEINERPAKEFLDAHGKL